VTPSTSRYDPPGVVRPLAHRRRLNEADAGSRRLVLPPFDLPLVMACPLVSILLRTFVRVPIRYAALWPAYRKLSYEPVVVMRRLRYH